MSKTFEQTDLTNGGRWHTIVLFLKSDFLERHDFASLLVLAFVDYTVCALAQLLTALILIEL